jgi:hypothetical protein
MKRWRAAAALSAVGKSMRSQIGALVLLAGVGLFGSANVAAAQRAHAAPYGVIEVGSKGVKAFVFDLDYARTSPCQTDPETWLTCVDPKTLPAKNVNPIDRKNIDAVGEAVAQQKQALMRDYGVAEGRIFVVGSSGVFAVEHRPALEEMVNVRAALGPDRRMDFITAANESSYAFEGIISMLPKNVQELRRGQALILDIGSGNTKGSYRDRNAASGPIVNFSIDWGTKKATDVINSQRGDRDFVTYAETFRRDILIPDIRGQFDNNTVAMSRPRIYAIGGIVWAVSNLSQPRNQKKFPPLTVADIDAVYAKATAPNAFALICSNNPDKAVNREIDAICEAFSIPNLIAGMQVLRGYAQEMNFANKNVFFFRDSQFAWPLGYLDSKLR